jgi:hypothetical protein
MDNEEVANTPVPGSKAPTKTKTPAKPLFQAPTETKTPTKKELCAECAPKLTPVGINWHDLCPKCYELFVK